jgi:hypothetical protein
VFHHSRREAKNERGRHYSEEKIVGPTMDCHYSRLYDKGMLFFIEAFMVNNIMRRGFKGCALGFQTLLEPFKFRKGFRIRIHTDLKLSLLIGAVSLLSL